MASKFEGGGDRTRIEILYGRLISTYHNSSSVGYGPVTAIAFAHKALLFWLNPDFADKSTNILIILALTNFFLAFLFSPVFQFSARPWQIKIPYDYVSMYGYFECCTSIDSLAALSITGAARAYLLSVLPVAYMYYHTERHYLTLSGRKGYYTKKILGTAVTFAVVWAIDWYLLSPLAVNLLTLLIQGGSRSCYISSTTSSLAFSNQKTGVTWSCSTDRHSKESGCQDHEPQKDQKKLPTDREL